MNLLEMRNGMIDQIINARDKGMCNQEILHLTILLGVMSHLLDKDLRAKINGAQDGQITQNLVDELMRGAVSSKLQIERLELKCSELDAANRCYISENESLEAKCQRLDGELKTSNRSCRAFADTAEAMQSKCVRLESDLAAMRLLSEHNRIAATEVHLKRER